MLPPCQLEGLRELVIRKTARTIFVEHVKNAVYISLCKARHSQIHNSNAELLPVKQSRFAASRGRYEKGQSSKVQSPGTRKALQGSTGNSLSVPLNEDL